MRCAAIHRKLGTHISKVKSLSMDTWSAEQVDVSGIRTSKSIQQLTTRHRKLEHEIARQPSDEQDL